ncbi:MAG: discoidin domain-containing protein, partial [Candidatus Aenigmarchaeota archaeon]|nr:discoidin domain-containing protein [Candidatus Aenigmarchaeota archaeon]
MYNPSDACTADTDGWDYSTASTYCSATTSVCCINTGTIAEGVGCTTSGATGATYDRDTSEARCISTVSGCLAQTWMSNAPTSGTRCCGDDEASDNSYYYSELPSTATTLTCERCNAGTYAAPATLYGNGYKSGLTCYYGDITCTASSASHGATCTMTKPEDYCIADVGCQVYDTTPSDIYFVPPTPNDSTTTIEDYTYINVTVLDESNTTSFIDWNMSLVGWWPFNGETDFTDFSTYSNDGTNQGSTYRTDGKFDGARVFDGIDDYVEVQDDNSLDMTDKITIEGWIYKAESSGSAAPQVDACVGGTSTAKSSHPTQPPSKAFDGDTGNYGQWQAATGVPPDQWLQYEMESPKQIETLRLYFDPPHPTGFTLRASNTGSFSGEEATLLTVSGLTGYGWHEWNFTNSNTYLYYRIVITTVTSNNVRIYEVEMIEGTASVPDLSGWVYTRPISLSPATSVADYQLAVVLTPATFDYSKAKSGGADLRFS